MLLFRLRVPGRLALRLAQQTELVLLDLPYIPITVDVEMVWQWVIDHLDLGIGQEVLIASVGFGNPELSGRLPRFVNISGSKSYQLG